MTTQERFLKEISRVVADATGARQFHPTLETTVDYLDDKAGNYAGMIRVYHPRAFGEPLVTLRFAFALPLEKFHSFTLNRTTKFSLVTEDLYKVLDAFEKALKEALRQEGAIS